jgi:hypothetical protein
MKQPTLLKNIGIALLLFAVSVIVNSILSPGMHRVLLLIALTTFLYLGYLMYNSPRKTGKFILMVSCVFILAGSFIFIREISSLLISCTVLIWLVRSLLYYSSIVSVLFDAVLCLTGLAIAGWAFVNSGFIAVATWSFFLVQSLHVLIPHKTTNTYPSGVIENDRFNNAHQTAEYAIGQMIKGATEKLV